MAGQDYAYGELIVLFDQVDEAEAGEIVASHGFEKMKWNPLFKSMLVKVPAGSEIESADKLWEEPLVKFVALNRHPELL